MTRVPWTEIRITQWNSKLYLQSGRFTLGPVPPHGNAHTGEATSFVRFHRTHTSAYDSIHKKNRWSELGQTRKTIAVRVQEQPPFCFELCLLPPAVQGRKTSTLPRYLHARAYAGHPPKNRNLQAANGFAQPLHYAYTMHTLPKSLKRFSHTANV